MILIFEFSKDSRQRFKKEKRRNWSFASVISLFRGLEISIFKKEEGTKKIFRIIKIIGVYDISSVMSLIINHSLVELLQLD